MDFFDKTGKMAIGSRLRMLTDMITRDAADIYDMYGVELRPKWFPVFYMLAGGEALTVTRIARGIGHSHPSVSNIVREMVAAGIVREKRDKDDARRTLVQLTQKGRGMSAALDEQCRDVGAAVERLSGESAHDLWAAIGEWERLLAEKSIVERVAEERRRRECGKVEITDYAPEYHEAFRSLNVEWITTYFSMEPEDYATLDNPQASVLDRGGFILIALYGGEPVGTVTVMPCPYAGWDFELVKYAVSPRVQGRGIGNVLMEACIGRARAKGIGRLFLESNRKLGAAIHLYRKYGFRELPECRSDYARGDIQMELDLNVE